MRPMHKLVEMIRGLIRRWHIRLAKALMRCETCKSWRGPHIESMECLKSGEYTGAQFGCILWEPKPQGG